MFKVFKVEIIKDIITVLLIVGFLSGCASSSRYIATPTAPPPDLGISSKDDNLSVTLNYLILPNGLGAWVKGARWDEYVLTVRSICNKALTVEKIRLIDPRGLYIESGADPEQLETLSEALAEQYKDIGISVAIWAVPSALVGVAIATTSIGTAVGVATAAAVLAPVVLVAAPIYYFGKQHAKQQDKEAIQRELTRRRLSTFTLSGNATITGSVFYPIIPNPKALVVDYRIGSEMKVLEISLDKLKGLHVASAGEEKK